MWWPEKGFVNKHERKYLEKESAQSSCRMVVLEALEHGSHWRMVGAREWQSLEHGRPLENGSH